MSCPVGQRLSRRPPRSRRGTPFPRFPPLTRTLPASPWSPLTTPSRATPPVPRHTRFIKMQFPRTSRSLGFSVRIRISRCRPTNPFFPRVAAPRWRLPGIAAPPVLSGTTRFPRSAASSRTKRIAPRGAMGHFHGRRLGKGVVRAMGGRDRGRPGAPTKTTSNASVRG